jgi:hypothetical protein
VATLKQTQECCTRDFLANFFLCVLGCFFGLGLDLIATGLPKNPKTSQNIPKNLETSRKIHFNLKKSLLVNCG